MVNVFELRSVPFAGSSSKSKALRPAPTVVKWKSCGSSGCASFTIVRVPVAGIGVAVAVGGSGVGVAVGGTGVGVGVEVEGTTTEIGGSSTALEH